MVSNFSACSTVKVQLINKEIKVNRFSKIAVLSFILKNKTTNKFENAESITFQKTLTGTLVECNYIITSMEEVLKKQQEVYNAYSEEEKKNLKIHDYWNKVGQKLDVDFIITGSGNSSMTGKNTYVNRVIADFNDVKTGKTILYASYQGGGEWTSDVSLKIGENLCKKLKEINSQSR
jgi:hypothetical protein